MTNQEIKVSIHNKFTFEITDTVDQTTRTVEAYNVVLDQFWEKKRYGGDWFYALFLGDGIGVPAATDTAMFNKIGHKYLENKTSTWSYDDLTLTRTGSIYLDENTLNGNTISEIGIAAGTANDTLVTHARLQDMNGNPIAIQKTATTRIRIYATVYVRIASRQNNMIMYNYKTAQLAYTVGNGGLNSISWRSGILGFKSNEGAGKYHGNLINKTDPLAPKDVIYELSDPSILYGTAEGNLVCGAHTITTTFGNFYLHDDWFIGDRITGEQIGTGDGVKTKYKTKFYGCLSPTVYIDGVQTNDYTVYPRSPVYGSNHGGFTDGTYFSLMVDETTGETILTNTGDYGVVVETTKPKSTFKNLLYDDGWSIIWPNSAGYDEYFNGLESSDDLVTWTPMSRGQQRVCKYFRLPTSSQYKGYHMIYIAPPTALGLSFCNIIFNNPPASGAVITIDYNPKSLRKTADNTMTIQFGGQIRLSPSEV